jgi:hypothetical protein
MMKLMNHPVRWSFFFFAFIDLLRVEDEELCYAARLLANDASDAKESLHDADVPAGSPCHGSSLGSDGHGL